MPKSQLNNLKRGQLILLYYIGTNKIGQKGLVASDFVRGQ